MGTQCNFSQTVCKWRHKSNIQSSTKSQSSDSCYCSTDFCNLVNVTVQVFFVFACEAESISVLPAEISWTVKKFLFDLPKQLSDISNPVLLITCGTPVSSVPEHQNYRISCFNIHILAWNEWANQLQDSVLSIKNLIKQLVFLLILFIFCLQLNFTVSWRNLFTHSYPPNLWTNFCGSCLGCRIPYSFICSSNLPLHLTNFHLQL